MSTELNFSFDIKPTPVSRVGLFHSYINEKQRPKLIQFEIAVCVRVS